MKNKYLTCSMHFCFNLALILAAIFSLPSCKKFIEVETPITNLNEPIVYKTDATAIAVLTGIYIKTSKSLFSGLNAVTLFTGLASDELILFGGSTNRATQYIPYYTNNLSSSNTAAEDFSASIYPLIYELNLALESLEISSILNQRVRKQLIGEAKFMRAFCYFYLVNIYGKIPLAITSDYKINSSLGNSSIDSVYNQIVSDLQDSKSLLSEEYVRNDAITNTIERVRPNKWVATALLSRVYLYKKEYTKAISEATSVINVKSLFKLVPLTDVFLANSNESIWQLYPVISGSNTSNTQEAKLFVLPVSGPSTGGQNPVYLSENIVNNFEDGDQRKFIWTGSVQVNGITYNYPNKYKVFALNAAVTEYNTVFRLSEQYLIRSESQANLGNIGEATSDLDTIRIRAGLGAKKYGSQEEIIMSIQQERRSELFTEWGHRWLDMKRTSTIDSIMKVVSPTKGGSWNSYKQFFPFRTYDIIRDPNLVQNAGYN